MLDLDWATYRQVHSSDTSRLLLEGNRRSFDFESICKREARIIFIAVSVFLGENRS